MRAVRFLARLTRAMAYFWLAGCLLFLLLGLVLTLLPFPVAWPLPVPWSLQSDFVETPDGRILVSLRYFCEVRCYDRSGSFVRAYPFPKVVGDGLLAVREDNVVYLYGIGIALGDHGAVSAYDANWNLLSQHPHATVRAVPECWELRQNGQLGQAPLRKEENRVDRVARRGDLLFSKENERSVFHCADGGTLERHGQTLVRRSAAGDVMFTCGEPWLVRMCALPWPGYLAFLAVVGLWLAKFLKPEADTIIGVRPLRIRARDDGARLRIAWAWFRPSHFRPLFMSLVWNSFVVVWIGGGFRTEAGWLFVFFGTPHAIFGLLLFYASLALMLNRTVIKATHEFLTVWNGPVPWYGNRKLAIGELASLCYQRDDKKEHEARCSYNVYALKKDGVKVVLADELGPHQVQFIVQKLERWIKIGDRAVECEMQQDDDISQKTQSADA